MGWLMLVKLLLPLIAKKKTLSFSEAKVLEQLISNVADLFAKSKRTCVYKTHECKYRDGACFVLATKGKDWKIDDIKKCPYLKPIKENDKK